jgi:hypothetical protein
MSGRLNLAHIEASLLALITTRGPVSGLLSNSIKSAGGIDASERINAYRSNVQGAHFNALDQAFPVTREVLGERFWLQFLQQEIEILGSTSYDIHAYGEFIPGLLQNAQQRRPELEDFSYLGDLALLEWHVYRIGFMADELPFEWKAFMQLAPDLQSLATLKPSQVLTVFRSNYPVDAIWHAHQMAGEVEPESAAPAICFIHRVNRFDVTVTRLSEDDVNLLAAIRNGFSLEKLSVATEHREPEATIQQLFDWIQRGWIVDFEVK